MSGHFHHELSVLNWFECILAERFGGVWQIEYSEAKIFLRSNTKSAIIFDRLIDSFNDYCSDLPTTKWNPEIEGWHSVLGGELYAPGLARLNFPLIELQDSNYVIHYDILGLTLWMLARVEEIGCADLDTHNRFPAAASHAHKYGYLDRPIVDEWLNILGQVIQRQWPQFEFKAANPKTIVSCDLDSPFSSDGSFKTLVRRIGGDVLKRKSIYSLQSTIVGEFYARYGDFSFDSNRVAVNTIMELNEKLNSTVVFNFIPTSTDVKYDNALELSDPKMRDLLLDIYSRGHEIGIHPGYASYCSSEVMRESVTKMRIALEQLNIKQKQLGSRQHFLRWKTPITARLLEENQIDYDSSLGYADHLGFRCGTCHEFPMFDFVKKQQIKLRQRPLILMECTAISKRYMGLGYSEECLKLMNYYRETCYKVGGNFTVLWHNSHLNSKNDLFFYQSLIRAL